MSQENETQVEELETETNEEYGNDQESTEEDNVQEQEQEEEQVDWQARYEEERQARSEQNGVFIHLLHDFRDRSISVKMHLSGQL